MLTGWESPGQRDDATFSHSYIAAHGVGRRHHGAISNDEIQIVHGVPPYGFCVCIFERIPT